MFVLGRNEDNRQHVEGQRVLVIGRAESVLPLLLRGNLVSGDGEDDEYGTSDQGFSMNCRKPIVSRKVEFTSAVVERN